MGIRPSSVGRNKAGNRLTKPELMVMNSYLLRKKQVFEDGNNTAMKNMIKVKTARVMAIERKPMECQMTSLMILVENHLTKKFMNYG